MYLSSFFRVILEKFIYFVFIFDFFSSVSKTKILKNCDIKSDSAICYENIFKLHFLNNVIVNFSNFRLITDKLIIDFTNDFNNIRKLNFYGYINLTFGYKYKLLVKDGNASFFSNIFTIIGVDSYFLIKSFLKKSDMILQFNHCEIHMSQDCSEVKKYIFNRNIKCMLNEDLFIGERGDFDTDLGIITLCGNVYILDKDNNYLVSDMVKIDVNNKSYKIFNVKDGYQKVE